MKRRCHLFIQSQTKRCKIQFSKVLYPFSCFSAFRNNGIPGIGARRKRKKVSKVAHLTPDDIDRNMRQFSRLAIRILQNASNKGHNEYRKRAKREVSLTDLSDNEWNRFSVSDNYFFDETVFHVQGLVIPVQDQAIADALNQLSEHRRNIILLKYYAKWTDRQIGDACKMQRATIQYQRKAALKILSMILKGG